MQLLASHTIPPESRAINALEANYNDFVFIDETKIQSLLDETEAFVATINAMIKLP